MILTQAQASGFHGQVPPPMRGMNAFSTVSALVGQGWAVQVQEVMMDSLVEGGWMTLCRDKTKGELFHLQVKDGRDWIGASLWAKKDALTMAREVLGREKAVGLNRAVRIFHAYAGVSEVVR